MAHRGIGQEALFPRASHRSSLDEIADLIDWSPIKARLSVVYAAPRVEPQPAHGCGVLADGAGRLVCSEVPGCVAHETDSFEDRIPNCYLNCKL